MFDAEARAALAEIAILWDKTERVIKTAERLRAEVVQPSINELRYGGRRLVDAMLVADQAATDEAALKKMRDFIQDCRFRCYCAQHDAFDASVLFVQRVIREYEVEFGIAIIARHFPWTVDLKSKIADADELIVSSRAERGKREEVYNELSDQYLPYIVQEFRKLLTNKDALVELIKEQDRRDRRDIGRFNLNLWVSSAMVLVAAVVGAAFTIWFERATKDPPNVAEAAVPHASAPTLPPQASLPPSRQ